MTVDAIDRITPTLQPAGHELILQDWHHLLFLHWELAPQLLQAQLPPGLSLDTFHGKAYVGLIPFTMSGVRAVYTPPLPWISSFHEINVRTYVHRNGADPGVWFFSLDASSAVAVAAARAAYKLPYFPADIDLAVSSDPMPFVEFRSRRLDSAGPANAHIRYRPVEGPVGAAPPGTLEHFLCERYILYTSDEQKRLHRARVHHQPYPLQRAEVLDLDETLIWSAGLKRGEEAPLRHYAREVNVKIYALESL